MMCVMSATFRLLCEALWQLTLSVAGTRLELLVPASVVWLFWVVGASLWSVCVRMGVVSDAAEGLVAGLLASWEHEAVTIPAEQQSSG